MSEAKFTPGPWRIGTAGPNKCPTIGANGLMVAMVAYGENHPTEANARLIAAAPAMLEALKTADALLYAHGKPVDPAITAAIALATGDQQ